MLQCQNIPRHRDEIECIIFLYALLDRNLLIMDTFFSNHSVCVALHQRFQKNILCGEDTLSLLRTFYFDTVCVAWILG